MYAGDRTPTETWDELSNAPEAVLVDVRTRAELTYVGFPDLSGIGKRLVAIEWQSFPTGSINDEFVDQLRSAGIGEDQPVYFLCRSGARSRAAATVATRAGYVAAYNVDQGFEGGVDVEGHRGTTSGWKAAGLPWRQG